MSSKDLTSSMLDKPTGSLTERRTAPLAADRAIEVTKTTVDAEIRGLVGTVNEGTALKYLQEEGLNPEEWEATHFRKIKYGKDMESVKFSFRRISGAANVRDVEELIGLIRANRGTTMTRKSRRKAGAKGFVVALGDMQFGKIDGDGVEGALTRSITYLEAARDRLFELRAQGHEIGHVHVAYLGDHIEGFTSQGGSSTWRTPLTLNEQIRLTRRVMFHSVQLFAQTTEKMTVAAIPGNHGRVVSANGSGTRYDDSHDTEALIAVSEACSIKPEAFGHVEFFVPRTDEVTVTLDVAGTRIAHVHGDRWAPNKHFDWWEGQAFGGSGLTDADVLLYGHYHHLMIQENGTRMAVQVPALEAESTWWRHKTGQRGNPGILTALASEGRLRSIEVVR